MPVCSAALVAVAGVGIWQSGVFAKPPVSSEGCYDSEFLKEHNQNIEGDQMAGQLVSPDDPHAKDKIVINKPETIGYESQDIGLLEEDFVEMTYDEILEYYSAELEPAVPEDLRPRGDARHGIYKRNGGTGEIYYDNNWLEYYNEDISRQVRVEASKGRLPVTCCVFDDDSKEKSNIRGVEILMAKIGKESYSAEFMVRDVGFRINSSGLSEEEFVDVVASIIEKNK